jgi:hypothetical protein
MARIVLKKSGTSMHIDVSGEATMRYAVKAKDYFASVVNGESAECRVDLEKVISMDLSFIEFLLSFQKTMIQKNKKIEFSQLADNHVVSSFLSRIGIDSLIGLRG